MPTASRIVWTAWAVRPYLPTTSQGHSPRPRRSRIAIISPKNPNPISIRPWVEGSGTDAVDVTLKEAVKTSPAEALRPGISTVIWSPKIAKVRPGKVLEIKDTPVKAGSVNVRMMLRFGPALRLVSVKVNPVLLKLVTSVLLPGSVKPNSLPPTITTVFEFWAPGEF